MSGNSEWKDGFLFLGGQLALDFLNTQPVLNGEPSELLPDFDALVRWFRAAALIDSREAHKYRAEWGETEKGGAIVEAIRDFRERLRKEVLAWEDGGEVGRGMIRELNDLMAAYPMRSKLQSDDGSLSTQTYFTPQKPEDLF